MRKLFLLTLIIVLLSGLKNESFGQTSATDYFRSARSGLWDAASSWESSPDGLANWVPASSVPASVANTITIRASHIITISNSITVDQVVVAGTMEVGTVSNPGLTINDGTGNDIIVQNGGVFRHNIAGTSALPAFAGAATLEVQNGGILEAATNNGNASNYANTDSAIASRILWADGAVFDWNNTISPPGGVKYFPALSAIPIFRFSKPASVGDTASTIINGLVEANDDVSMASSGKKIFRNGITGTGKVSATSVNGGQFIINGATALLGGTGALSLNNSGLLISPGTALTLASNKSITNYGTSNSTITVAGTLIAGDYTLSGNTKVQIDGTVRTGNVNGLSGGNNTSFSTSGTVKFDSSACTIEYNRLGDQTVTTPVLCKNLTISGSGIKTVAGNSDIYVSGLLNIIAGCNLTLNGTDNLKLNGGGTLNINPNAVFDNGSESQISGGSSPTINIYGTFITRSARGFSGTGTSIPGATSTSPTVTLNIFSNSTIEYGKMGDQVVNPRDDYKNITFSGSGIKTIPKCNPFGTVTIKDNVVADVNNRTFGDSSTNLTMTGGRLKVGGIGTKPDIAGTYNLTGGVIEFITSGSTTGTIRSPLTYLNIEVSGSNVANSKGIAVLADKGSFTVKSGGVFENSGYRIDGITGDQIFKLEAGAVFKTGVRGGFSGNDSAALRNIETLVIDPKSTIIYSRSGNQTITPLAAYPTLLLKGSGIKTVTGGMATIVNATDSVVIDTTVVLKVSAGAKLDFQNCAVIVHSNARGTGVIGETADGPSALLNATNITVERYVFPRRSFRFVSPSVITAGGSKVSIKDNWMEGAVNAGIYSISNPHPGYGTNITGRNPEANSFDPTKTTNPSLLTYNTARQGWDTVTNSNLTLSSLPGTAYALFVRGDRSTNMTIDTPALTSTILRAAGKLFTGTYSPVLSNAARTYTFIGNPFASPVDFEKMSGSAVNVSSTYWAWDPHFSTRGMYVAYNAMLHKNMASDLSGVDKNIQSGQAVFVQTVADGSAAIDFRESFKSVGNTKVFRPVKVTNLAVQLLLGLKEGPENTADVAATYFDDSFSAETGNEDSYKFINPDENLAISHQGIFLSMEGRPQVTADDSILLRIWQLKFKQKNYYLKLTGNYFTPGLTAFIKDNYLHKETAVDLLSVTLVPFDIDSAAAGSFAADRFTIVLKTGNVLPVILTDIKAYSKDGGIQVNWTAKEEANIERYEVEKSADGQHFNKVAVVHAKNNNPLTQTYSWLDENASTGSNFYRIKIIEKSGAVKYSEAVNVKVSRESPGITISPNPIQENVINLQINNIEKGTYTVDIYNNQGQKVYNNIIKHNGLSGLHTLRPERIITKGVYRLTMTKKDKTITKTLIFL